MIWLGIFLGIALTVLLAVLGILFLLNKMIIRTRKQAMRSVQRLSDYGEDADVLVLEDQKEKFCQFKKFICSEAYWGVDFVLPLIEVSHFDIEKLKRSASERGLNVEVVPTPFGWSYCFVQVTRDGLVDPKVFEDCLSVSEISFDTRIGFGSGSTLDWMRKEKVFGRSVGSGRRYDVEQLD
jgi:hypothetical protein